jgi:hypothetical protein
VFVIEQLEVVFESRSDPAGQLGDLPVEKVRGRIGQGLPLKKAQGVLYQVVIGQRLVHCHRRYATWWGYLIVFQV